MKTAQEFEREIIDALPGETGKDLKAWLGELKKSGLEKRNDLLNWLKKEQDLSHSQANVIVSIHFNGGKPVYQDTGSLRDGWFGKKEHMRPLFEKVEKFVNAIDRDVTSIEKKTYMSFNGKREFAVASVKSNEIRMGMDLGSRPFDGLIQQAKSLGAMPRISHMVIIEKPEDLTSEVRGLLQEAWDHVHA